MNIELHEHREKRNRKQKVVARFGGAALIKQPDGMWQLKGGTKDDKLSAREWVSLFQHEAVFQFA